MNLDHVATSTRNVGLYGLLHGAVGVVEDEDSVTGLKKGGEKRPSGVLEDDGGGGGGVVNDGDFIDVVGVDQGLNQAAGPEDGGLKGVEVEVVGLAEVQELVALLGSHDGGGAAAKAAVVYPGDGRVVVGEFCPELPRSDGFGFRIWVLVDGGGAVDERHLGLVVEVRRRVSAVLGGGA